MNKYNAYEKVNRNLYKLQGKYYRLFGTGITPNGCWVINPKMVELVDINIATGLDVYGGQIYIDNVVGTVNACNAYISYLTVAQIIGIE